MELNWQKKICEVFCLGNKECIEFAIYDMHNNNYNNPTELMQMATVVINIKDSLIWSASIMWNEGRKGNDKLFEKKCGVSNAGFLSEV